MQTHRQIHRAGSKALCFPSPRRNSIVLESYCHILITFKIFSSCYVWLHKTFWMKQEKNEPRSCRSLSVCEPCAVYICVVGCAVWIVYIISIPVYIRPLIIFIYFYFILRYELRLLCKCTNIEAIRKQIWHKINKPISRIYGFFLQNKILTFKQKWHDSIRHMTWSSSCLKCARMVVVGFVHLDEIWAAHRKHDIEIQIPLECHL